MTSGLVRIGIQFSLILGENVNCDISRFRVLHCGDFSPFWFSLLSGDFSAVYEDICKTKIPRMWSTFWGFWLYSGRGGRFLRRLYPCNFRKVVLVNPHFKQISRSLLTKRGQGTKYMKKKPIKKREGVYKSWKFNVGFDFNFPNRKTSQKRHEIWKGG